MEARGIRKFISVESASGLVLFAAAVLAIVVRNSSFADFYQYILGIPISIQADKLVLSKPLELWVNDGLMSIFFLLVGLEIKREVISGELKSLSQIALPAVAALGGMLVPALVYLTINASHPASLVGWAIPTATDIAFSLGILSLLGNRIPSSFKVFLTALAIFDDIGAIVIIALFYSANISLLSLTFALSCLLLLVIMNRSGIRALSLYLLVGAVMWVFVLESGVHATLTGVLVALTIPLERRRGQRTSPLRLLERSISPWVAFAILPLFAFSNVGISLSGLRLTHLLDPITLGVTFGLFVGKQIGVFLASTAAIRMGIVKKPTGMGYLDLYGVSLLCGVGFTMSLFIGGLAFDGEVHSHEFTMVRLGVVLGSLLSGVSGYLLLRFRRQSEPNPSTPA